MAKKTFPDEEEEMSVTPNRPEIEKPSEPGNPGIPQEDPQRQPSEIPPSTPPPQPATPAPGNPPTPQGIS